MTRMKSVVMPSLRTLSISFFNTVCTCYIRSRSSDLTIGVISLHTVSICDGTFGKYYGNAALSCWTSHPYIKEELNIRYFFPHAMTEKPWKSRLWLTKKKFHADVLHHFSSSITICQTIITIFVMMVNKVRDHCTGVQDICVQINNCAGLQVLCKDHKLGCKWWDWWWGQVVFPVQMLWWCGAVFECVCWHNTQCPATPHITLITSVLDQPKSPNWTRWCQNTACAEPLLRVKVAKSRWNRHLAKMAIPADFSHFYPESILEKSPKECSHNTQA
jgi:hypothetical protein